MLPSVHRPALAVAAVSLTLVGLSACGGTKFAPEPPLATTPTTVKPSDPGPITITVQNANDVHLRPSVRVNTGALPDQLQTTDLIPGTGREAKATDTVTVQYVAAIGRTGQEFAATWDN